jgi:arylsulfatase A-like enzyme
VKKFRALYHGSLKFLDDQIERIVSKLEALGILEETYVVFSTDHGECLGDHGLIAKGVPQYDLAVRCPLLVLGGGLKPMKNFQLCQTLDLFPTFCAMGGVTEFLPPHEGKSLFGALSDTAKPGHEEILITIGQIQTLITDDGYRMTRYNSVEEGQLFNLAADPLEQVNLYNDPDYAEKKLALFEKTLKILCRPYTLPQYKNMPVFRGEKVRLGGDGNSEFVKACKHYGIGKSRYLDGGCI